MTTEESLEVSRAVDALLTRRSEMHMGAPAALVLGELTVRIECEPPYLPPHVRIRPRGALGKRIEPLRGARLSVSDQIIALRDDTTVVWKGMASSKG